MKRVIIVVEGQTEQEFVKQCLAPYLLLHYGILDVTARLIGKPGHKGGDVRFQRLQTDVALLLREGNVVVSTFIDFFKLATDFPDFDNCQRNGSSEAKVACLKQAMSRVISDMCFIPYIQRHEFEALLFASHAGFEKYFSRKTCDKLKEISMTYSNPEDINNDQPPSYRLKQIIESEENFKYDKVAHGTIVALEIGVDTIMKQCRGFDLWIGRLVEAAKN